MFGYIKVLRKEKKNTKKNNFLMFGFIMENTKKESNIFKIYTF